jgi:protein SCO1/2
MKPLVVCVIAVAIAWADDNIPPALEGVGIDQRLSQSVPLDLAFREEHGRSITLRELMQHRPVVLALVYYECPMLCTLVLNGLVRGMRGMSLELGGDYDVITVSINPHDTPSLAAAKRKAYLDRYAKKASADSWRFLTGDEAAIRSLADSVGFRYTYDPQTKQYAHAAGIIVLTPEGKISRYFYGIEYSPRDLRLGLVEASGGKVGSPVDQLLLFCYHYDPKTGRYGAAVMNSLRIGGAATLLLLSAFVIMSLRRERKGVHR